MPAFGSVQGANPGSLQGTMPDLATLLTQYQALEEARQQELAQQTQQAQQQLGQAQGQYQQATQAPAPELNPMETLIPSMFSGLASIIAQNPSYHQERQRQFQQQRSELMQARSENLMALRENFKVKAEQAKQAGDIEAETKFRLQHDRLDKQMDVLLQSQRESAAMDRVQAERGAMKEQAAATAGEATRREAIDNVRGLMQTYISAGQSVPEPLMRRARTLGIIAGPEELGGARKPYAVELRASLSVQSGGKAVPVLTDKDWLAQEQLRLRPFTTGYKGKVRKETKLAARVSLRTFHLGSRRVGETPEQFVARMKNMMDPADPKNPLYTREEVMEAWRTLFTDAERGAK